MSEECERHRRFSEKMSSTTHAMRERLPKKVYKELHKTIDEGKELDPMTAEVVASRHEETGRSKKGQPIIPTGSSR